MATRRSPTIPVPMVPLTPEQAEEWSTAWLKRWARLDNLIVSLEHHGVFARLVGQAKVATVNVLEKLSATFKDAAAQLSKSISATPTEGPVKTTRKRPRNLAVWSPERAEKEWEKLWNDSLIFIVSLPRRGGILGLTRHWSDEHKQSTVRSLGTLADSCDRVISGFVAEPAKPVPFV